MYSTLINGKDGMIRVRFAHTHSLSHILRVRRRLSSATNACIIATKRRKKLCARERENTFEIRHNFLIRHKIMNAHWIIWNFTLRQVILLRNNDNVAGVVSTFPLLYRRLVVLGSLHNQHLLISFLALSLPCSPPRLILLLFISRCLLLSLCVYDARYIRYVFGSVSAWIVKDVHFRESLPKHLSAMKWNKSNFTTHFVKMKTVFTSFRSLSRSAIFFSHSRKSLTIFCFMYILPGSSSTVDVDVCACTFDWKKERNANGNVD